MKQSTINICCNTETSELHWEHSGKKISLVVPGLVQAMADQAKEMVFAVTGSKENYRGAVAAFSFDGSFCFDLLAPPGYTISYLAENLQREVCVVCSGEEVIDDWHDWQFLIDVRKRSLVRSSPSY